MAAIAPIVIKDGAATPADRTFTPVRSNLPAIWRENLSSLPESGQLRLVIDTKSQNNGTTRVRVSISAPAMETATGSNSEGYTAAPRVGYTTVGFAEFVLPSRSTGQQIKDVRSLLGNALLNAQVIDVIDNRNTPY